MVVLGRWADFETLCRQINVCRTLDEVRAFECCSMTLCGLARPPQTRGGCFAHVRPAWWLLAHCKVCNINAGVGS